jgi:peptide/nickel transport system permease protein
LAASLLPDRRADLLGVATQSRVGPPATAPTASLLSRLLRDYVTRRIAKAIVLIFCSATLTFFLIRLMPSNPVEIFIAQAMVEQGLAYDQARDLALALFSLDIDQPLWLQYLGWLKRMAALDMGESYISKGTPVTKLIGKFLPWTIFSVGTSLVISFTLGMLLGMLIAYRRNGIVDHLLSSFSALVTAIPAAYLGVLLVVFLGVQWKLVSIHAMRGSMTPGIQPGFTLLFIKDIFYHAALPIATYVLTTVGAWMLFMKSSTMAVLEDDYVTVARARGLSDTRITFSYVGRNAMLPLFTQLTIALSQIFGGALVIELVFVYQGIGLQLLEGLLRRDYPVVQGVFLVVTVTTVLAQLAADLLYSRLDPRIKAGGESR